MGLSQEHAGNSSPPPLSVSALLEDKIFLLLAGPKAPGGSALPTCHLPKNHTLDHRQLHYYTYVLCRF